MDEERSAYLARVATVYDLSPEEMEVWERRSSAFTDAGRNSNPDQLSGWWRAGELTVPVLRALIIEAWQLPEFPQLALGERRWLEMFRASGFVSDTGRDPPDAPMTLYRGAPLHTRGRGMSWTPDAEKARWFAARRPYFTARLPAGLFRATVPPHAVLALIEEGRGENEAVLNPRCLRGRATPELVETVSPATPNLVRADVLLQELRDRRR